MDLEMHKMDVNTTLLKGELDVEIYMEQPKGFEQRGREISLQSETIPKNVICKQRLYEKPCGSLVVRFANLPLHLTSM